MRLYLCADLARDRVTGEEVAVKMLVPTKENEGKFSTIEVMCERLLPTSDMFTLLCWDFIPTRTALYFYCTADDWMTSHCNPESWILSLNYRCQSFELIKQCNITQDTLWLYLGWFLHVLPNTYTWIELLVWIFGGKAPFKCYQTHFWLKARQIICPSPFPKRGLLDSL